MPPPIAKDISVAYDDYVHLVCTKCKESMNVEYLGLDPTMPQIRVTCPKCSAAHTWKIYNASKFGAAR